MKMSLRLKFFKRRRRHRSKMGTPNAAAADNMAVSMARRVFYGVPSTALMLLYLFIYLFTLFNGSHHKNNMNNVTKGMKCH